MPVPFTPDILFEDNHLLVVNKPQNIPVQGDASGDPDLLSLLKNYIKTTYHKPGNVFLGLVHRLDRPVAGVMVFAKTSKAASRISEQIRNGQMEKEYLAVVAGVLPKKSAVVTHYLEKNKSTNVTRVFLHPTGNAKEARLSYEVLGEDQGMSLLRVQLLTGRSHQIRAQLSALGHPIIGDVKYGGKQSRVPLLALFSETLGFLHPTKKEPMKFSAPQPQTFPWNAFNK